MKLNETFWYHPPSTNPVIEHRKQYTKEQKQKPETRNPCRTHEFTINLSRQFPIFLSEERHAAYSPNVTKSIIWLRWENNRQNHLRVDPGRIEAREFNPRAIHNLP